jgi:hypothetical protein
VGAYAIGGRGRAAIGGAILGLFGAVACRPAEPVAEPPEPARPRPVARRAADELRDRAPESTSPSGPVAKPVPAPVAVPDPVPAVKARVLAPLEGGALAIDVRPAGDAWELVALELDGRGRAHGEPQLVAELLHDPAEGSLAADTRDGSTWLAWTDREDGDAFSGFVTRALQLPASSEPIVVARFPEPPNAADVHVVALADGRAVVATASVQGRAVCESPGRKRCIGPGYEVVLVGPSAAARRLRYRALDGGDLRIEALVDLGDAVAVAAHAWRGGVLLDGAVIPYSRRTARGRRVGSGAPARELFAVGRKLVTLAENDYCPPEIADRDACAHLWISTPKSRRLRALDVTAVRERCADGTPTREIAYAGGVLNVAATGVWTGEALLDLERDTVNAWVCDGAELVPAKQR